MEPLSTRQKWEAYFNMLNHALIFSSSLYVTWHCAGFFASVPKYTMHVWFCTIGYQLLMTEAILAFYTQNNWSFFHSSKTKRTLHWVMQLIGSFFAILGTIMLYIQRRRHFSTIHSITGLISLILLLIGAVNGVMALYSQEFRKLTKVKPVYSKFFHNAVGIAAFVIGMVSLYYGYEYKFFKDSDDKDIRPYLIAIVVLTTVLSLVGAFKALWNQLRSIVGY